jgi:hypothetical protein
MELDKNVEEDSDIDRDLEFDIKNLEDNISLLKEIDNV